MKFTKMHGAGNDFIIVDIDKENIPPEKLPGIVKKLCSRRTSVGADGFMAVTAPTRGGDYRMMFYNADGTLGEMCGNGARCIARYGYVNGYAGEIQRIETTAGLVTGERIDERRYKIRLNDPTVIDLDRKAEAFGKTYDCVYVELGDPGLPHAVVLMDDLDTIDKSELFSIGKELRWSPAFPKGANVNFCQVVDKTHVNAITFERGVEDFTLACGTGAGSTATVLAMKGLVDSSGVNISMPGGVLTVTADISGEMPKDLYLTGPTNIVAVGEITDEDLNL